MLPAALAAALSVAIALVVHLHHNADHVPALGRAARPLELAAVAAIGLIGVALSRRLTHAEVARRPWRLLFYALALGWASSLVHPYEQGASWYTLVLALGLWAALVAFGPRLRRRLGARATDAADVALMNLAVLFVGAELGLRLVAAFVPSPLLAQQSTDARHWLDANKLRPGSMYLGFPVNSRGFYDDEPGPKRGCRVAAVGDSFTVGVVPHAYHFTTVAERALGCEIDALGVVAVGPEEYELLVREAALPLDPDVVVIDLFVGNDIVDNLRGRDRFRGAMRRWLDRDDLLVYVVPQRLVRLLRERAHRLPPATPAPRPPSTPALDADATLRAYPWLADPSREPPSMSHATYLALETRHAREVAGGGDDAYYARLWALVDKMRAEVAPRPLAVVVIPDELQVEEPLWREIVARAGAPLERDRPQRLVLAGLHARGIPALDLLPRLRAVPVGPDGWRHLYHRDDSHLDARGNAVVGEALAAFLRPLVRAR